MWAIDGLARFQIADDSFVANVRAEPCLFACAGVALPTQAIPRVVERIQAHLRDSGGPKARALPLMVVSATLAGIASLDCQLSLPLAPPQHPSVVRMVPPLRRGLLDYGVYDQFYDVPGAAKAALKLEDAGIYLLGQLVQMSEEAILAFPFMDETILETMRRDLARFDLAFNMRHPNWNRRFRDVATASL